MSADDPKALEARAPTGPEFKKYALRGDIDFAAMPMSNMPGATKCPVYIT